MSHRLGPSAAPLPRPRKASPRFAALSQATACFALTLAALTTAAGIVAVILFSLPPPVKSISSSSSMSVANNVELPDGMSVEEALEMSRKHLGGLRITKISVVKPDFDMAVLSALTTSEVRALASAAYSETLAAEYHRGIAPAYTPMMDVQIVAVCYSADAPDGIAAADRTRLMRDLLLTAEDVDLLAAELRNKRSSSVTHYSVRATTSGAPVPTIPGDDGHGPIAALVVPLALDDADNCLARLVPFACNFLLHALTNTTAATTAAAAAEASHQNQPMVVEYAYGPIAGLNHMIPASRAIYMRLQTPRQALRRHLDTVPLINGSSSKSSKRVTPQQQQQQATSDIV